MNNVSILENVHPILYISDVTSDSIVIENKTDNRVILYDFTQLDNKSLVIDNYRMTIKNDDKLIPVSKVGWTDDNIYWFRLKKGKNLISFTGNGTVVMEMESVRKAGCC